MENKKTKLTLSGIAKKSIENIELAKTQSKNTVVIEKKNSRFSNRSSFSRTQSQNTRPAKPFVARPTTSAKPAEYQVIMKNVNLLSKEQQEDLRGSHLAVKIKKEKLVQKKEN